MNYRILFIIFFVIFTWETLVCKTVNGGGGPLGTVNYEITVYLDGHPTSLKRMTGIHVLTFCSAVFAVQVDARNNSSSDILPPQFRGCPIAYTVAL